VLCWFPAKSWAKLLALAQLFLFTPEKIPTRQMPARTLELWGGVLQNTRRAGGLPLSVDAVAVTAAATALIREQPAGGAVRRPPPPPPPRTAALLKLVAVSCLRAVGLGGAAPDALGKCLRAAGWGGSPSYNPLFLILWLRGREISEATSSQ